MDFAGNLQQDEGFKSLTEDGDNRRGQELIAALEAKDGHLGEACASIGMRRQVALRLKDRLPWLHDQWTALEQRLIDDVEAFAVRLASGKVKRKKALPIGDGQYETVEETVISDRTLALVLGAHRDQYRADRVQDMPPAELARVMAEAARANMVPEGAPLEKLPPAVAPAVEAERIDSAREVEVDPPAPGD